QNGDMVEILTSPKATPKEGWLDMVITSSAKAHVRKYLREHQPIVVEEDKVKATSEEKTAQLPRQVRVRPVNDQENSVVVDGTTGYLVKLAKCCKPAIGDSIIGI